VELASAGPEAGLELVDGWWIIAGTSGVTYYYDGAFSVNSNGEVRVSPNVCPKPPPGPSGDIVGYIWDELTDDPEQQSFVTTVGEPLHGCDEPCWTPSPTPQATPTPAGPCQTGFYDYVEIELPPPCSLEKRQFRVHLTARSEPADHIADVQKARCDEESFGPCGPAPDLTGPGNTLVVVDVGGGTMYYMRAFEPGAGGTGGAQHPDEWQFVVDDRSYAPLNGRTVQRVYVASRLCWNGQWFDITWAPTFPDVHSCEDTNEHRLRFDTVDLQVRYRARETPESPYKTWNVIANYRWGSTEAKVEVGSARTGEEPFYIQPQPWYARAKAAPHPEQVSAECAGYIFQDVDFSVVYVRLVKGVRIDRVQSTANRAKRDIIEYSKRYDTCKGPFCTCGAAPGGSNVSCYLRETKSPPIPVELYTTLGDTWCFVPGT
jgi:hypothetical protein